MRFGDAPFVRSQRILYNQFQARLDALRVYTTPPCPAWPGVKENALNGDSDKKRRIGVIDLGSNTGRLIVMEAIPGYAYRLADEIRELVRLREGMTKKGLSSAAVERAMFTLRLFKRFCDATHVDTILPTTTSAVREAANGPEFVRRVEQETGLRLEILSGEREAYYAMVGTLNEMPMDDGYVIDIGGGSCQICKVRERDLAEAGSLPLGALALTERFVEHDPITDAEYEAVRREIEQQLDLLGWLGPADGALAGVGGTIRNLAKIEAKRQNYPLNTLHGFRLSRESVEESIEQFRELPQEEREEIAGLNEDRADIILPGAMALAAIMDRLEKDCLTISVNGIREGLFLEMFWQHLPTPIIPSVRHFSVLNMARIYQYDKRHATHVRFLAGRLFEQLAPLHDYGVREREILEAAALLHDLGTLINYDDHHKHSLDMIINRGLPGYTPRETALIALMARYHRKGSPDIDDFETILNEDDEKVLIRLAAILRLAEYLERGRNGAVEDVSATWNDNLLRLALIADIYPAVELWEAERHAVPLVEEAFGRRVRIDSIAAPHDKLDHPAIPT
jgi:exopolyphosphatase/guanosine-5'-triphosphate,3'-diphosphate pyrophosphatase